MKSKKGLIIIFLVVVLSVLGLFICQLPKRLPPKQAQILKDLAYDSDKRLGYTIYIPENGKLEPYLVLTKNYYKQGNVLLMRKYLVEAAIPHKEIQTTSYYAESIPDRFMNELFIHEFPSKLSSQIKMTTLNIKAKNGIQVGDEIEKIKRKLFLLLEKEVGIEIFATSDEKKIGYFIDKKFERAIASTKDGTLGLWWLRGSGAHHFVDLATLVTDYGGVGSSEVRTPNYLRPSFCLPPNTKIAKETIKGQEIYVLKAFQDLKLPKANILVEDIGLTGHDLEKYYIKHNYLGIEVELKNPQYGGVLSDNLTVAKGESVQLRALTFSDGRFDGWYLGDKLISCEKLLTYQLTQNETILAKFSKKETFPIE
ncbi:MAG: DUF6273 domain-containing protein [Lactococcus chungangensis]